jgi:hypothetical protein
MLAVSVKADVKAAVRKLGQIDRDIDISAQRAINSALKKGNTVNKQIVSKYNNITQKEIKHLFRIISASKSNLTGFLIGMGRAMGIDKNKSVRVNKKEQVVRFKAGGKVRHVTHAWQSPEDATKYSRRKPGDKPRGLSLPSVPQHMMRNLKLLQTTMLEQFGKEFLRQINMAIKR